MKIPLNFPLSKEETFLKDKDKAEEGGSEIDRIFSKGNVILY